jgi:hypothetical protein
MNLIVDHPREQKQPRRIDRFINSRTGRGIDAKDLGVFQ